MARIAAHQWSPDSTEQAIALSWHLGAPKTPADETRTLDPWRLTASTSWFRSEHARAQLQPGEQANVDKDKEKEKEEESQHVQRPSTGRTTALGRKVEKPAPARNGGPSGQTDGSKHDWKHANK